MLALLFTDLTQLGAGHQQAHLDLLPDVVVFTRLGAEGQSGVVLRLGGDGVAARRHLLEDIAVGHGIADRHTIHQHRHFDSRTEGLVAIDIEVGRIPGGHKLLGLGVSGGIGHGYGCTTGKQRGTHHYLPEHSDFLVSERRRKVRMGLGCRATTQTAAGVTRFNIPTINRPGAAL